MCLFFPPPIIYSKDSTDFYIWHHFWSDVRDICHFSVTLRFYSRVLKDLGFSWTQNKTTHRLWMLQSKQGDMPRNLFWSKEKKTARCWSRWGSFNSHWSCWIFHSQHSFLPNRSTNEEQLKSKPSDRRRRRHTMKSFFLHKTPEWFQTAASAGEQRQASAKLTKLYSVGSVVVLILYSKITIQYFSNSWKQILFLKLFSVMCGIGLVWSHFKPNKYLKSKIASCRTVFVTVMYL